MKMMDLANTRFGRLVALDSVHKRDSKGRPSIHWRCVCDCGNIVTVAGGSLRASLTRSCGCLLAETRIKTPTKHGWAGTRIYNIWQNMRSRCNNRNSPAFSNYGGRGIKVCDRWQDSFDNFLKDVGNPPTPQHSIDRYPNNNGNYEPRNVRWATASEQARNTRQSVFIDLDGKRLNLMEASEQFGVAYDTLHNRIKDGNWTAEQALNLALPPKRGGWKVPHRKRISKVPIVTAPKER